MTDPYQIEPPALISFSGGRTSGYMLRKILDAHEGRLPQGIVAAFANTGKEMPQTLDFVRDCGERWGVQSVWLEYNPALPEKFEVVTYKTASRSGEPFERLLANRGMLPNPVTRFCTAELLCGRPHNEYLCCRPRYVASSRAVLGFQLLFNGGAT
jgi:3'-phosphoadenosine 5'-phosphosulfate sulfotransferase (PAPS reductase)/FAD synthetase